MPVRKFKFNAEMEKLSASAERATKSFKKFNDAIPRKVPLTKRARRQAKKAFPKVRHTPWGYTRYGPYQEPEMPAHVKTWLEEINQHALKLFKAPYTKLSSRQQSEVFEDINSKGHQTVH